MLSFKHVFISIAWMKPKKTFTSIGHHPSDFCDQILLHESQILEKKIYVREFFISESEVEADWVEKIGKCVKPWTTHVVAPTTLVNTMTQRFPYFNLNFSML
jgi:hypothetical protein